LIEFFYFLYYNSYWSALLFVFLGESFLYYFWNTA